MAIIFIVLALIWFSSLWNLSSTQNVDIALVVDLESMNNRPADFPGVSSIDKFMTPFYNELDLNAIDADSRFNGARLSFVEVSSRATIVWNSLAKGAYRKTLFDIRKEFGKNRSSTAGPGRNVEAVVKAIHEDVFRESTGDRPVYPNLIIWLALLPPPATDSDRELAADSILKQGVDLAIVTQSYDSNLLSILKTPTSTRTILFGNDVGTMVVNATKILPTICQSSEHLDGQCYFDENNLCVVMKELKPPANQKNKYCSDGYAPPVVNCPQTVTRCFDNCDSADVVYDETPCSVTCGSGTKTLMNGKAKTNSKRNNILYKYCPQKTVNCDNDPCPSKTAASTTEEKSDMSMGAKDSKYSVIITVVGSIAGALLAILVVCLVIVGVYKILQKKRNRLLGPPLAAPTPPPTPKPPTPTPAPTPTPPPTSYVSMPSSRKTQRRPSGTKTGTGTSTIQSKKTPTTPMPSMPSSSDRSSISSKPAKPTRPQYIELLPVGKRPTGKKG